MKRLFIDGVTKRSRKISEVNPRVSIDLEQYVRQVIAAVGGGSGSSYTFENALTEAATVVKLGGSLTQDTNIDGNSGANTLWITNLKSYLAYTTDTLNNIRYNLGLNVASSATIPLNGADTLSLNIDKSGGYGAGYFLTEDGIDPRPYIVSEMSYGGGAARTAKVEFSNDYLLNSHKIYDVSNPTGAYREYLTRLGDSQLTLEASIADSTDSNNIALNIVNTVELSPTGIRFTSISSTGTPLFEYTFPITSLSKPMPQMGYSMILNNTGTNFDFVKDIKTLSYSLFDVAQTVVAKRIRLAVPFTNYVLESITVCQPSGGGTLNLKVSKAGQSQDVTITASGSSSNHVFTTISNPVSGASEFVEVEVNAISNPAMTQLSITLNFLYAG